MVFVLAVELGAFEGEMKDEGTRPARCPRWARGRLRSADLRRKLRRRHREPSSRSVFRDRKRDHPPKNEPNRRPLRRVPMVPYRTLCDKHPDRLAEKAAV